MIKKLLIILLMICLTISFAACGSSDEPTPQDDENTAEEAVTDTENETEPEEPSEEGTAAEATSGKILIVYFTPANSDTADAVSSATPRVGDVSSVEYVASLIGDLLEADVAKITAVEAYPLAYGDTADQAKEEQNNDERPEFTLDIDPEDYDVIVLGYPIWWYRVPMILQTFFDKYDLSGKTIVPYVLHGGSRDGGTFDEIAELEPGATVLEGIAINGDRADKAGDDVTEWLKGLGMI